MTPPQSKNKGLWKLPGESLGRVQFGSVKEQIRVSSGDRGSRQEPAHQEWSLRLLPLPSSANCYSSRASKLLDGAAFP